MWGTGPWTGYETASVLITRVVGERCGDDPGYAMTLGERVVEHCCFSGVLPQLWRNTAVPAVFRHNRGSTRVRTLLFQLCSAPAVAEHRWNSSVPEQLCQNTAGSSEFSSVRAPMCVCVTCVVTRGRPFARDCGSMAQPRMPCGTPLRVKTH